MAEHPGRFCAAWEEENPFQDGELAKGCLCFWESSRVLRTEPWLGRWRLKFTCCKVAG